MVFIITVSLKKNGKETTACVCSTARIIWLVFLNILRSIRKEDWRCFWSLNIVEFTSTGLLIFMCAMLFKFRGEIIIIKIKKWRLIFLNLLYSWSQTESVCYQKSKHYNTMLLTVWKDRQKCEQQIFLKWVEW